MKLLCQETNVAFGSVWFVKKKAGNLERSNRDLLFIRIRELLDEFQRLVYRGVQY